jgi:hypothetical protein
MNYEVPPQFSPPISYFPSLSPNSVPIAKKQNRITTSDSANIIQPHSYCGEGQMTRRPLRCHKQEATRSSAGRMASAHRSRGRNHIPRRLEPEGPAGFTVNQPQIRSRGCRCGTCVVQRGVLASTKRACWQVPRGRAGKYQEGVLASTKRECWQVPRGRAGKYQECVLASTKRTCWQVPRGRAGKYQRHTQTLLVVTLFHAA